VDRREAFRKLGKIKAEKRKHLFILGSALKMFWQQA